MSESAGKMKSRIQAVRQWLNQAEEHFGRNSPVRGEMDLLLAEAELRSTRETLQKGHSWLKLGWLRQGVAFLLAVAIATVSMGGVWWWLQEPQPPPVAAPFVAAVAATNAPEPLVPVRPISTAPAPMPAATVESSAESMNPGKEVKNADKPINREVAVSQDEMKRLIQAAGQSLRGRTKP
ncbi:MAG: hypothetical protein AB9917_09370 [Negativicutes bacterium]